MSTKATPDMVAKCLELAGRIQEHDEEIEQLREHARRLNSLECARANLATELEQEIKAVDLAPGNHGWEKRIAWFVQEVSRQAARDTKEKEGTP